MFKIGDKVVCIDNHPDGFNWASDLKYHGIYTVTYIDYESNSVYVDDGVTPNINQPGFTIQRFAPLSILRKDKLLNLGCGPNTSTNVL